MCRIANISLLQRLKGSMSGDARDFSNIVGASCHDVFFFLQGKASQEIHTIMKSWVVQFKRDDFSTCGAPRPGRPKTVTTPEIIIIIIIILIIIIIYYMRDQVH
jgi:hypothetical protein